MNVLVVSSWCPFPPDNGSRVRAFNLLKQLSARGHCLTLLALSQPETEAASAVAELAPLCAGGVTLFPPAAQRPHPPSGRWLPRSVRLAWNADMERAVADAVQSGNYERALFLEPGVMMYAPPAPAVPCLLDCMEVSRFVRQRHTVRVALMLWKLRRYLREYAPRFALWTAVSSVERDTIAAFVGPCVPLHILPNGVDLQQNAFTQGPPVDPARLVLNGAPDFAPNAAGAEWFASNVLPRVRAERPDAHLWVTGRADTLPPSHSLRHAPNVTLTGFLDDVRPAIAGAAVCVVPLFQGGGTRLKVLEAMALGTPVVSTTIGAEGIGAVHGEHLLLADTPQEFAHAVLSVLHDPALRERLRRAARRFVEASYGWDAISTQLDALLSVPCP